MLLDLLLPAGCTICDTEVAAPGQLCAGCFAGLSLIAPPLCRACGVPFATQAEAASLCGGCAAAAPPWGEARAALKYDEAARRLILPLKHADRTEIAETLALHMHRAGQTLLERADLLVPVPLHRWRLLHRRYNQSALLAYALTRRTGRPTLPDALRRIRATMPLGGLSAAQRASLMQSVIAVRDSHRAAIAGRHILLIDDVLTSGATARACTRALLDAGAKSIDVLVASRVADPRRDIPSGDDVDED